MESNTVKISSSFHTLLRFPFSFFPLILLPYLLDISLLWSSFCLLVLFHLLLSFTPPPSLCVLKTCRQESLQREYFISVQLSSPLYIRDRVFPAKLCNSASLSSPEHLVFSLHGSLLVSLVFWPSVVSASKTIPLSLCLSIAAVSRYAALFPTLPHFLFLASSRPPYVSFTETIIAL